jgi:hypothetical protein
MGVPAIDNAATPNKGPNIQGMGVRNHTHSSAEAEATSKVRKIWEK